MEKEQTVAEAIIAAMNKLTDENWIKGNYFKNNDNKICMCAHGAVQSETNSRVKEILLQLITDAAADTAPLSGAAALCRAAAWAALTVRGAVDADGAVNYYGNVPEWITKQNSVYGNLKAHYCLGLVGLTTSFNDHKDTTLQMVKEKMLLAAKKAEEIFPNQS